MGKEFTLNLEEIFSILTEKKFVDDDIIKMIMELMLDTKLTDNEVKKMKPIVKNYIIENYPQFQGIKLDKSDTEIWIKYQKQIYGDEFTFQSATTKSKIKRKKLGKLS